MALKILQAGTQPLGQFDALDSEATSFLGGEIVTFGTTTFPGTDKGAADLDGYSGSEGTRAVVTKTLSSGNRRPLFLCDEGSSGYGTLFGQVVGATVGQIVTGGTSLGPHTVTGSGKVTLWDKAGLYGVTTDAVDTTHNTGLVTTNLLLNAGDTLYATTAGLITPTSGSAFSSDVGIGYFVEFSASGSLVTTPRTLVSATNSPSGSIGSTANPGFTMAVIYFDPQYNLA